MSRGAATADAAGVAAVVLSPSNSAIASIAMAAPVSRLSDDTAVRFAARHVVAAADAVSEALRDAMR